MSGYTEAQFIAELKASNAIIAGFDDIDIATFLDKAFRAFSGAYPEIRVSADNDVVDGQELYDLPDNALGVIAIRDSDSRARIAFAIENQGSGDKIRLGSIIQGSLDTLLENPYYVNPIASCNDSQGTGFTSFDIEYTLLQAIDTVSDSSLESIAAYVEHLACRHKASEVSASAVDNSDRVAESITDQDSSGASTTIKYSSSKDMAALLKQQADDALERYKQSIRGVAYGTRG